MDYIKESLGNKAQHFGKNTALIDCLRIVIMDKRWMRRTFSTKIVSFCSIIALSSPLLNDFTFFWSLKSAPVTEQRICTKIKEAFQSTKITTLNSSQLTNNPSPEIAAFTTDIAIGLHRTNFGDRNWGFVQQSGVTGIQQCLFCMPAVHRHTQVKHSQDLSI